MSLLPVEPPKPKQVPWDSVMDIPFDDGPVWVKARGDAWKLISGVAENKVLYNIWFLPGELFLGAYYHVGDIRDVLSGKVEPKPCMKDAT